MTPRLVTLNGARVEPAPEPHSIQTLRDELTRLRAEAALEEAAACLNRTWADQLYGQGKHAHAAEIERRAVAQDIRAIDYRIGAAVLADRILRRTELTQLARDMTGPQGAA